MNTLLFLFDYVVVIKINYNNKKKSDLIFKFLDSAELIFLVLIYQIGSTEFSLQIIEAHEAIDLVSSQFLRHEIGFSLKLRKASRREINGFILPRFFFETRRNRLLVSPCHVHNISMSPAHSRYFKNIDNIFILGIIFIIFIVCGSFEKLNINV